MRSAIASYLISITIALLPIYKRVTTMDLNRTSKDNLLMILFGFFAIVFKDTKRDFPLYGWIVLAFALFLNVYNQHNVLSLNVMMQSFYISFAMFFFVRFYECFDVKYEGLILNGMCIGALIQCLFVLSNMLGFNMDMALMSAFNEDLVFKGSNPTLTAMVGTLGNANLLSGYLSVCCVAFFRRKWIYSLPIPLLCLAFNMSSMGIVAVLGGAFFYFARRFASDVKMYVVAIVSMIGAYFVGLNGLDSGRFQVWKELISKYDWQVLVGYGPGWFPDQAIMLNGARVAQEHSLYLSVVSVFGLFGLGAVVFMLFKVFSKQIEDNVFVTMLFAIMLNGYGHFSLHQSTMVIIIIVALSICLIKEEKNEFSLER